MVKRHSCPSKLQPIVDRKMKGACPILPISNRLLVCLVAGGVLIGCTTLESRMSIEPYTKNKPMRNAVERVAEEFCRKKRTSLDSTKPIKQPDFIFTTDGCSRWPDDPWLACCIVHDIAYWCGGSEQDRKDADQEFMQCVNNKMGIMGNIMYPGIRMGGSPWFPTPWRWGYGWGDWPKGYEKPEPSPTVKRLIEELKIHEIVEQQLSDTPVHDKN